MKCNSPPSTYGMNQLPKVLVIGPNTFSKVTNTGKTLASLFKNWKAEKLAQIFFGSGEIPDFDICANYFRITCFDVLRTVIRRSYICGKSYTSSNFATIVCANSNAKKRQQFLSWLKKYHEILMFPVDLLWKSSCWKSRKLEQWIEEFSPELIFLHAGAAGYSHQVAWWICQKYQLPLCVYCTDDYVVENGRNLLGSWKRIATFRHTMAMAETAFVIGDYMAERYTQFFGREFLSVMNCIEDIPYEPEQPTHELRIVFIGGVHLNRWKALAKFGKLINSINTETAENIRVDIFCAQELEENIQKTLSQPPLFFCGKLSADQVTAEIKKAHCLLHVESEDRRSRMLTKMSISTKIPEYLISGRCLIACGPHEVASIRLVKEKKVGVVISDLDDERQKIETLKTILFDPVKRAEIGQKGRAYAQKNFLGKNVRRKFEQALCIISSANDLESKK